MVNLEALQATMRGMLPELLGIRLTEATPDRVVAEMEARDQLCTLPGTIHASPFSNRSIRGTCSRYFDGARVTHMSGGSMTWPSAEISR